MTNTVPSGSQEAAWHLTAELKEIADVDQSVIAELLNIFLEETTKRLKTLVSASGLHDFKVVSAQAHNIKGIAAQIGAVGLASVCAELEYSDGQQTDVMVRSIQEEFVLVRGSIEAHFASKGTVASSQETSTQ